MTESMTEEEWYLWEKAHKAFLLNTQGWITTNPHTLVNIKYAFQSYVISGDEDELKIRLKRYYKDEHMDNVITQMRELRDTVLT